MFSDKKVERGSHRPVLSFVDQEGEDVYPDTGAARRIG